MSVSEDEKSVRFVEGRGDELAGNEKEGVDYMNGMKRLAASTSLLAALLGVSSITHAEGFYFGEETKGAAITSNEADLNIRILLQPRLDAGDIIKSKDGTMYEAGSDIYFRRIRVELAGSLLAKTIKYNLTLKGDKWDKAGNANDVLFHYAYIEWEKSAAFAVMAGKHKLPYSRVSLISDANTLIIEGPLSTEEAKKLFGKSDAYYQPKLAVKGKFMDGALAYEAALADGWQNGEAIQTGRTVFKAQPVVAARVELSPPGLTDPKKSVMQGRGQ
ncbi:MAG: hypothetical protein HZB83_08545 [Deltaproteobacteria bacterium]|nr:hypothetical protein [Deltaproteobacteria bacterium]